MGSGAAVLAAANVVAAARSGGKCAVPLVVACTRELEVRIPKLRAGSFFPCLLERRRIDQALFAV